MRFCVSTNILVSSSSSASEAIGLQIVNVYFVCSIYLVDIKIEIRPMASFRCKTFSMIAMIGPRILQRH
jgi:hypothetical protein